MIILKLQNTIDCWARGRIFRKINKAAIAAMWRRLPRTEGGIVRQVRAMLRGCMQLYMLCRHMQDSLFTCVDQPTTPPQASYKIYFSFGATSYPSCLSIYIYDMGFV